MEHPYFIVCNFMENSIGLKTITNLFHMQLIQNMIDFRQQAPDLLKRYNIAIAEILKRYCQ